MKAVIQRAACAQVSISGEVTASIGKGFLVLLGILEGDGQKEAEILADKLTGLRVFEDETGKMNRSLHDVGGELLVVSNFTLGADCRKGRRPSFIGAAKPEIAHPLYEYFLEYAQSLLKRPVSHGIFGADMQVSLVNDGPVTILLDTNDFRR